MAPFTIYRMESGHSISENRLFILYKFSIAISLCPIQSRNAMATPSHSISVQLSGVMMMDQFQADNVPNDVSIEEHPMDWNWAAWYQLHYYDLVVILYSVLVILCIVNLCATVRKRQQSHYDVVTMNVECESDCDVEAMPIVQ